MFNLVEEGCQMWIGLQLRFVDHFSLQHGPLLFCGFSFINHYPIFFSFLFFLKKMEKINSTTIPFCI